MRHMKADHQQSRMSYNINIKTGEYWATGPSPTGVPSDPVLTALGINQSKELAIHLENIQPPIDEIYCSPYYRCLQTLLPTTKVLFPAGKAGGKIKLENGFSEFHGRAWFAHPKPATLKELDEEHFPEILDTSYECVADANVHGETIDELHDRLAYALHRVIEACDARPDGPKAILICTHAACMIAMGRALTGLMPDDFTDDDFQCYTAGVSMYKRRKDTGEKEIVLIWDGKTAESIPTFGWRGGKGVLGGWDCLKNSDCSWLSTGPERGW
jgi:transcription factor C subunit 7